MNASPCALWWLQRDLRLVDHPALHYAARAGLRLLPVYIDDPATREGAAARTWRQRSLQTLDARLREHGSRLHCLHGDAAAQLARVAQHTNATAVLSGLPVGAAETAQHRRVQTALREAGAPLRRFNTHRLFDGEFPRTKAGDAYKVFTPYWNAARAQLKPPRWIREPLPLPALVKIDDGLTPAALAMTATPAWDRGFWAEWTPGEAAAQQRLDHFIQHALGGYASTRDLPAIDGSSRLSPHLHFGELSPWRIVQAALHADAGEGGGSFIKELGWREFAHDVLLNFPLTERDNFNPRFDDFDWAAPDAALIEAWQQGRTGIPMVDAGMRQLWHTGWMHNRLRMIVGSFLCKHLRQHWRVGADWFMDTLIDADIANNTLGWQWVAGTGVDAAPYFRVFNPVTQGQRFDPAGEYIARWLPPLAALPAKLRHTPWLAEQHGLSPPAGYPAPIIDLAEGREAALTAFARIRR